MKTVNSDSSNTPSACCGVVYFEKAIPLARNLKDKAGEAFVRSKVAGIYFDLGQREKTEENYLLALDLFKQINDLYGQAQTLNQFSRIYYSTSGTENKEKAINYLKQALTIVRTLRQSGDDLNLTQLEAAILQGLGIAHGFLNQTSTSLDYFLQAVPLHRAAFDINGEAATTSGIAAICLQTEGAMAEKLNSCQPFAKQSLALLEASSDSSGLSATRNNLSVIYEGTGQDRIAAFLGKQVVQFYQKRRENIQETDEQVQKEYLKTLESFFKKLAAVLIKQERYSEANQILNIGRDQTFFDFDTPPIKRDVEYTLQEIKALKSFSPIVEELRNAGNELDELNAPVRIRNYQSTNAEIDKIRQAYLKVRNLIQKYIASLDQVEKGFKASDSDSNKKKTDDTVELENTLQNLFRQTGEKTVAVYTLVAEDNFCALIVSPDGIKAISTPIKGTELNEKALKLWSLLQSDRYDTTVLSKQIYDAVFAPIEKELPKDTTTIMWSLDGNLRYLPMAALWDGRRFLAERFNNVNFTRADGERLTRAVNPNWTGTGFGSSNAQTVELLGDKISFTALPGVTAELKEIFKQSDSKTGILTGEVLPDKQFTKTSFLDALRQKRPVVHIASHFSFRPGDEARSFLLLGDGTALTLNEMKAETNLFAGVDLLTLSACNTAAAQADANGREIDGFAELAQRLGAGAVMATLWSVSDASTPWLMRDFYATKQSKSGMTKAEALRQAQLALLNGTAATKPLPAAEKGLPTNKLQIVVVPNGEKSAQDKRGSEIVYIAEKDAPLFKKDDKKPFAHPYYWSPFILFGNWR